MIRITRAFVQPLVKAEPAFFSFIRNMSVGQPIPQETLFENDPTGKVDTKDLCAGKKVIIFGVPGAFTPGCSKTHLPSFAKKRDDLISKGIDEVVCVAVNDPFVMAAWGKEQGVNGKIRMLADTKGKFTKALGLELDLTDALGGVRCKRFSMIVEDGVVKELNVEPDGTGLSCSLAEHLKV